MKKITLLFAFFISSLGFSQEVLQDFENGGLDGAFDGATASIVDDPQTGGTRGKVAMLTAAASGEPYQGVNISMKRNVDLTTNISMSMDVYSTVAISIAPSVVIGVEGAPTSTTSVAHTGSGWETLTFSFDQGGNNTSTANGAYSRFVVHYLWDPNTNNWITPAIDRTFYVDNITGIGIDPPAAPDAPSTAAPTPPARNASDVVSIFSDAYSDITVDTFNAGFCTGQTSEVAVQGNATKLMVGLGCVGIDFKSSRFDANEFTHFHMDFYTETATLDKSFNLKFSNWNGGTGEANAIQFSTTNVSSPALPNPNPGTWISLDIPLSAWVGYNASDPTQQNDFVQFVITSDLQAVYFDNLYLYKEGTASVANESLASISLFPNPVKDGTDLRITAKEEIQSAKIYNVIGKEVMSVTINSTSNDIDVSSLNAGVYLIKYTINNAVGTSKFIKQ